MKKPRYQLLLTRLSWILLGFLALGTFFDAISNAISIITLKTSIVGTSIILVAWIMVQLFLKHHPITWITDDGSKINIKRLRAGINLPILGMVILLWLPLLVSHPEFSSQTDHIEKMTGDFRIAVAIFSEEGSSTNTGIGNEIANGLYLRLQERLNEVNANFTVEIWGPDQIGLIKGVDVTEQATSAAEIAEKIGADLLVYGSADFVEPEWEIAPKFYVSVENFYEAVEVVGQHELGTPIIVARDITDRIYLNDQLTSRVEALAWLTIGLAYYSKNDFLPASDYFQKAENVPNWDDSEGKEVVYLLIGNTAGKNNDLELAKQFYSQAVSINPGYVRGYAGLGNVYYAMAISHSGENEKEASLKLTDTSIQYYQQAVNISSEPLFSDIDAKAHFGLGRAYLWQALLLQSDLRPAAQEFNWVIADYNERQLERLRERAAEAHVSLGLIYRMTSEDVLAIREYEQAIALIKDIPQLQGRLATYYAALGDEYVDANLLNEAITAYQQAIQLTNSPDDAADFQEKLDRVKDQLAGQ